MRPVRAARLETENVPKPISVRESPLLRAFSTLDVKDFKKRFQGIPTKSGLMLGLGEEISEVEVVMQDLRDHGVSLLTLGQYLQPTRHHLPVERYVHPQEFKALAIKCQN